LVFSLLLVLPAFGFLPSSFYSVSSQPPDLPYLELLALGASNPEPSNNALWRVTEEYRAEKGSAYIYQTAFPSMSGSAISVNPSPSHLLLKGPTQSHPAISNYKIHCLIHSSIPSAKNLDYPRWHQRAGANHQLFRLFEDAENLWGGRNSAARIEAASEESYVTDPANPEDWHSFEGTLTILVPIPDGKVFQGFNAMLQGWWAAGDMVSGAT
jgi:hypothetical protein